MTGLVLSTADWVPRFPRGYVRDLRVRCALEEAMLPYTVATRPFDDPEAHPRAPICPSTSQISERSRQASGRSYSEFGSG